MKSVLTLLVALLCSLGARAVTTTQAWSAELATQPELAALSTQLTNFSAEDFLELTPKEVRAMTGEKLGVKGTLALKAAQKAVKQQMRVANGQLATDIPKGLYVVGAIFGFAWLLMGLMDDFQGNNWWLNLILYFLCFIPGLVHALIKMKDYY